MKEKHKGQPHNLKHYWLIFSLLAIVLLIPFRIINNWFITNIVYLTICTFTCLALFQFVRRFGSRHWIVVLLTLCAILPIIQIKQNGYWSTCIGVPSDGIIEQVECFEPCDTQYNMVAIADIPIIVQIDVIQFAPCPFYPPDS